MTLHDWHIIVAPVTGLLVGWFCGWYIGEVRRERAVLACLRAGGKWPPMPEEWPAPPPPRTVVVDWKPTYADLGCVFNDGKAVYRSNWRWEPPKS